MKKKDFLIKVSKSFNNIINYKLMRNENFTSIDYLFHFIPLRIEVTFILLFYYNPVKIFFFCSNESYKLFIKYINIVREWFYNKVYSNLPEFLKKFYSNNFLNNKKIKYFFGDNIFKDYDEFSTTFNNIISNIFSISNKKINKINSRIDITGGQKLHSIIMAETAKKFDIPITYVSVFERNNPLSGIHALNGTEIIYEKFYDNFNFIQKFIYPYLSLLITNSFFILFYNNQFYKLNINNIIKNKNKIENKFSTISLIINQSIFYGFEDLVIASLEDLNSFIKKLIKKDLAKLIKSYDKKVLLITPSKELINFPFNIIFRNKIIIKSIKPFNYLDPKDLKIIHHDRYSKQSKLRVLILILNREDIDQKNEVKFLKHTFSQYQKINYKVLNLEKNILMNFNEEKFDIIHYTGHSGFDNNGFYFGSEKTKFYINEEKIRNFLIKLFKNTKFLFLNSCLSSNIFNNYENSLHKLLEETSIKCYIGTTWLINTNSAYKFIIDFYSKLFEKTTIYEAFVYAIEKNDSFLLKYNYNLFGNPFFGFE